MLSDPPPSPGPCSCAGLRRATRHLTQYYDQRLTSVGLKVGQFSLLSNLARWAPISPGNFAERLAMDRTTMGRNLLPLEREGLVAVTVDPADRRARLVSITQAGRARLLAAHPIWAAAQTDFETRFGAGPAQAMRMMLADVCATRSSSTP